MFPTTAIGLWKGGWFKIRPMNPRKPPQPQPQFSSFRASSLYCPQCRQATPARERLLLVLPNGNLYEYYCARCGTSTGSKTEKEQTGPRILY